MKKLLLLTTLILTGCGYSSKNSEMIGQIKKVTNETPLICSNFSAADVSLGIIRDGVGSMSSQDIWTTVPDLNDYEILKKANESGALVKITYDVKRITFCIPDHIVTKVELVR